MSEVELISAETMATTTTTTESNNGTAYTTAQIVVLGCLAGATTLVTIAGNLVVLLSFLLERSIRQPSNYFVASLAVSDLIIGCVSMPFYTVYLLAGQNWPLGEVLCDLWLSIDYTVCLSSIYTVLCITVDRYCSVKIPTKYRNWRTEFKVRVMICVVWIVPVSVFFTTIFGWQYIVGKRTVPDGKCYVQYMESEVFNAVLQVGYFWITLIVMVALYSGIYRTAVELQRRSERKRRNGAPGVEEKVRDLEVTAGSLTTKFHGTDGPIGGSSYHPGTSPGTISSPPGSNGPQRVISSSEDRFSTSFSSETDPSSPISSSRQFPEEQSARQRTHPPPSTATIDPTLATTFHEFAAQIPLPNGNLNTAYDDVIEDSIAPFADVMNTPSCGAVTSTYGQCDDVKPSGETNVIVSSSGVLMLVPATLTGGARNGGTMDDCIESRFLPDGAEVHPSSDLFAEDDCDVWVLRENPREVHLNPEIVHSSPLFESNPLSLNDLERINKTETTTSNQGHGNSRTETKLPNDLLLFGAVGLWFRHLRGYIEQKRNRKSESKKEGRARKALRTITLILGAFVMCWTPWHVLSMIIGFCPECVWPVLYDISYWLCYLNSPLNPFCYAFANRQFKKTFIRIVKLDWHRS